MRTRLWIVATVLIMVKLLNCGCSFFLPSGEPPAGNIVDPFKVSDAYSLRAAENIMITDLSRFAITSLPFGVKVAVGLQNSLPNSAWKVVDNVSRMQQWKIVNVSECEYVIYSDCLELSHDTKVLSWKLSLVKFATKEVLWVRSVQIML